MAEIKICTKCGNIKALSEFYSSKKGLYGKMSKCKKCCLSYKQTKEYKEKRKKYHQSESFKNSMEKYLLTDKSKKRVQKFNLTEKRKIIKQNYNQSEAGKNTNKIWQSSYRKKKYINDIQFNISIKIRSRLYHVLRKQELNKNNKTIILLGCSYEKFKKHIESLFTDGMSWGLVLNGEIHIDHIKPCSSFDLTDPEQQKQCFHYTNLQPLWATTRIINGVEYIGNLNKSTKIF